MLMQTHCSYTVNFIFHITCRQKSDLKEMVKGIERLKTLLEGDNVLIVEGCTHHKQDDILLLLKFRSG